jgi:hypothetical protein
VADRPDPQLEAETARTILQGAGVRVGTDFRLSRVRSGNEVYGLDSDAGTFFLKIPVKDLETWPDPLDGAAAKVTRELA